MMLASVAAGLSRVQHGVNTAAEEDGDHPHDQEKPEIYVVDYDVAPLYHWQSTTV
jgi:hypothetical protein